MGVGWGPDGRGNNVKELILLPKRDRDKVGLPVMEGNPLEG